MIHVLKHVESITQHRDCSLLEAGVASALFELVKAKEVNLYKVQSEESGHFSSGSPTSARMACVSTPSSSRAATPVPVSAHGRRCRPASRPRSSGATRWAGSFRALLPDPRRTGVLGCSRSSAPRPSTMTTWAPPKVFWGSTATTQPARLAERDTLRAAQPQDLRRNIGQDSSATSPPTDDDKRRRRPAGQPPALAGGGGRGSLQAGQRPVRPPVRRRGAAAARPHHAPELPAAGQAVPFGGEEFVVTLRAATGRGAPRPRALPDGRRRLQLSRRSDG